MHTAQAPAADRPSTRRTPSATLIVALCVAFTVALRLPFLGRPLNPDEAGLLIVAHNWSEGPYLYGDFVVGRGVLALAVFAVADHLGGALALRLLACVVASGTVVAAGWAGFQLRGRSGAGWAGVVAASYSSTYLFGSQGMNERLLAAMLVMAGCALALWARGDRRAFSRSVLAGAVATLPLLVVQSYADALVFGLVVLAVSAVHGVLPWREAVRAAAGGLTGVAAVLGGLLLIIGVTPMALGQLRWQMAYRVEASRVVAENERAVTERMEVLLTLGLFTGAFLLVASLAMGVAAIRARRDLLPVWVAVWAMLAITLASMVAGGDYWPDYPLQAIPALALAAALVAPSPRGLGAPMRIGAVIAAAAALAAVYLGLEQPTLGSAAEEGTVGAWIEENSSPGETGVVLFGKANVLHSAGLDTPYPYLWSLLVRTLDPDLDLLVRTLSGPEAPTWVVQWYPFDAWDLDAQGRLAGVLERRYVEVAEICGRPVYLERGEQGRDLTPPLACPHFG